MYTEGSVACFSIFYEDIYIFILSEREILTNIKPTDFSTKILYFDERSFYRVSSLIFEIKKAMCLVHKKIQ